MPGRFPSAQCCRCREEEEPIEHRYVLCRFVSESWIWLRSLINLIDTSTCLFDDLAILRLDFFRGLKENAIIWLLGNYIELVESEVIVKENKLQPLSMKGFLKQKKLSAQNQHLPDLGLIPGLDWESEGVG